MRRLQGGEDNAAKVENNPKHSRQGAARSGEFRRTADFTKFTLTRRAKHWYGGIIGVCA